MSTTHPAPSARHARPAAHASLASRRFGYTVAIVINAVLLYLVNRSPGWEALPFLTAETAEVIPFVNASIVAGIVANALYLVRDPVWLRAAGDLVTTGVGLLAMVRIWQVWPLDLTSTWDLVARWVIGIGIAGSLIGIMVAVVKLTRWFGGSPSSSDE